jgi:8-oxo-dGTP pyrophosphatase MutT (NUDIX family)
VAVRAVQGSVCFVRDEDKVLLLCRNHDPFKGMWDGLTGLVEFGESPLQAARREALEESGLIVDECEHRGHLLLYNTESLLAISADLFVAWGHRGELRGSEEGLPVWVPIADIPRVDLIGFVHTTLPLILVPQTFLAGTIRHLAGGEIVDCELCHYQVSGTKAILSGLSARSGARTGDMAQAGL